MTGHAQSEMLVTLTIAQLSELIHTAVRDELKTHLPDVREVLTLEQAADLLEMHPRILIKYARDGLPSHKIGPEWRFRRSELLDWLSSRKVA